MFNFINNITTKNKLKAIIIILMVFAIVWSITSASISVFDFATESKFVNINLKQIINDEEIEIESADDFIDVDIGETLVLIYEVPEMSSDNVILFYSKDVEVEVYIQDEEIYSFTMNENFEFLETPGNKWNVIDIPKEYSGETVRIELTSNFDNRFESIITSAYFMNTNQVFAFVLRQDGYRILSSVILFVSACFVYVNCAVWKNKKTKKYFIHLANFYIGIAIWLISMYSGFNYFIGKPIFSYIISVLMPIFLPVALYELVKIIYDKNIKVMKFLEGAVWINLALQMFLQFVFKISLLNLLPLTIAVYFFGASTCIILIIYHIFTEKNNYNFQFITLLIIFLGAVAECVVLCVYPERIDLIGFSSVFGMIIYLIVNHFYILNHEAKMEIQKNEIETSYNKLQNTTLIHQIKGHFFFNTLNTISALCKYDSREADRAINIFAKYMRSYMHLINEQENIPFEKEMEIIEATLEIEKLRFYDSFTYEVDLECVDFKIPPLALQVIIENSILHGLRKNNSNGVITVKTRKFDDCVKVIVSDNGVGFDTNTLIKNPSIGLQNLEKRIRIMANGEMKIKSEVGKGTEVTITLPYGFKYE